MRYLARELTKLHESAYGETLGDLCVSAESGAIVAKGEFTLVVCGSGKEEGDTGVLDRVLNALLEELPTRQAARLGAAISGTSRRFAYQRALALRRPE